MGDGIDSIPCRIKAKIFNAVVTWKNDAHPPLSDTVVVKHPPPLPSSPVFFTYQEITFFVSLLKYVKPISTVGPVKVIVLS